MLYENIMKKLGNFLRSMRFGIILLSIIAVLSVVGSLLPQGREISFYAQNYSEYHGLILLLQLNDIFSSWYFVLLMALLALNLSLCSLVHTFSMLGSESQIIKNAAMLKTSETATAKELRELEDHLLSRRCKKTVLDGARVYSKNRIGRYGSFITHLAILLTLIFGAAGLYLPEVTDKSCLPGESVTMPDGTEIAVSSFTIENESGQLDFESHISVTLGETGQHKEGSIKVNHPMNHGPYKIYQQNYGTAGAIIVTNLANNGSDTFVMAEASFLSLDGENGLWFRALYPDYYVNPDGSVTPVNTPSGRYERPLYHVQLTENGENSLQLALPGDVIELGGLRFEFDKPVEYPGLRIKYTPPMVNKLLFAAFALMIIGLYITFFMQPVLVRVDDEGYSVGGAKPEAMRMELQDLLDDMRNEEKT